MSKLSFRLILIAGVIVIISAGGYIILSVPEIGSPPEDSEPLTEPADETRSQVPTPSTGIPPGYSSEIIQVKFRQGTDVDQPEELLPPDLRNSMISITRLFSLPEDELNEIRPDLHLWFQITLKPGTDAAAFMEALKRLDNVEIAEPAPLPAPPP